MTKIQWTDETWNPVVGCSKVHTGCTHCYAEVMAARPLPAFVGRHNLTVTDGRWNGRIVENSERLLLPLKWRKPRRVFVASMSDLGHPALSDEARARIYGVMLLAGHHTFQNLTKRPAEIERFKRAWSPARCLDASFDAMIAAVGPATALQLTAWVKDRLGSLSWDKIPHIHEYVSVSDQATADEFIPQLLRVPAAIRGVSLEPMVWAVDLRRMLGRFTDSLAMINHVIVGGESGRNARPLDVMSIWDVILQCKEMNVPVFVKQMGSNSTCSNVNAMNFDDDKIAWPMGGSMAAGAKMKWTDPKGGDPSEWPADLRVRMHVGEGW